MAWCDHDDIDNLDHNIQRHQAGFLRQQSVFDSNKHSDFDGINNNHNSGTSGETAFISNYEREAVWVV